VSGAVKTYPVAILGIGGVKDEMSRMYSSDANERHKAVERYK
jgi:hypothetical protein